jgi:hypothetical protein
MYPPGGDSRRPFGQGRCQKRRDVAMDLFLGAGEETDRCRQGGVEGATRVSSVSAAVRASSASGTDVSVAPARLAPRAPCSPQRRCRRARCGRFRRLRSPPVVPVQRGEVRTGLAGSCHADTVEPKRGSYRQRPRPRPHHRDHRDHRPELTETMTTEWPQSPGTLVVRRRHSPPPGPKNVETMQEVWRPRVG